MSTCPLSNAPHTSQCLHGSTLVYWALYCTVSTVCLSSGHKAGTAQSLHYTLVYWALLCTMYIVHQLLVYWALGTFCWALFTPLRTNYTMNKDQMCTLTIFNTFYLSPYKLLPTNCAFLGGMKYKEPLIRWRSQWRWWRQHCVHSRTRGSRGGRKLQNVPPQHDEVCTICICPLSLFIFVCMSHPYL